MTSKLADGSEWSEGIVLDECGGSVRVSRDSSKPVIVIEQDDAGDYTAHVADVIAVIDRANLDPVRIAARELIDKWESHESREFAGILKRLEELL